jgi:hypothetical protein
MALRNLNRTETRGRVCGTVKSGVAGLLVPSTGTHGPAYTYPLLSLPTDNTNEIRGYITSVPGGLTLYAYEDTSFFASGPDGTYIVPFDFYKNGVYQASHTFQITIGTVTINTTAGNAVAAGVTANIIRGGTVLTTAGNAVAGGITAIINTTGGVIIGTQAGNANALGITAIISNPPSGVIVTTPGNAVALGISALVTNISPPPPIVTTPGTFEIQGGTVYIEEVGLWMYQYGTVYGTVLVFFQAMQKPKVGDFIVDGQLVPRTTPKIVGRPDWYNPRWE